MAAAHLIGAGKTLANLSEIIPLPSRRMIERMIEGPVQCRREPPAWDGSSMRWLHWPVSGNE